MALGADCIDDCDVLRAGRTGAVLGHRVAAPSTLGTFLRSFTFGHVRQLDRVLAETLDARVGGGRRPGRRAPGRSTSTRFVGEVLRPRQAGRRVRLHARARLPPDARHARRHRRGAARPPAQGLGEHLARELRFVDELIARVARAGATGPKLLRADSGFWSTRRSTRLDRRGLAVTRSASACSPHVRAAIEQIDEHAWQTLDDYPPTSIAQIAETTLGGRRLVVRRVRTLDRQGELLPSWQHFPFVTNRTERARTSSRPSTASTPSSSSPSATSKTRRSRTSRPGTFTANAAWTVIACLAHNLLRWTARARPARPDHPRRPHPPPPAARAPRPADPHRPALDAAPARPLALAARLHRSAHPHPRAAPPPDPEHHPTRDHARPGDAHRCQHQHHNPRQTANTAPLTPADHRHRPPRQPELPPAHGLDPPHAATNNDRWIEA